MSDQEFITTSEPAIDDLTDLLIAYAQTSRLQQTAPIETPEVGLAFVQTRIEQLTAAIDVQNDQDPQALDVIKQHEAARVAAGLGMLAALALAPELTAEERTYQETTYRLIGRSALVLEGLAQLEQANPPEPEPVKEELAAIVAIPATPEVALAKVNVYFNKNGNITVNGQELKLLPVQKYLFELFLLTKTKFLEADIYKSPAFEEAIRNDGQRSLATGAYNNSLRGLLGRLEVVGVNNFVRQVDGGPRSRVLRIEPSLVVTDERAGPTFTDLAEAKRAEDATELTNYIFDILDPTQPGDISIEALTRQYFHGDATDLLSPDEAAVLEAAIEQLAASLQDDPFIVVHKSHGLIRIGSSEEASQKTERGEFVRLLDDRVEYEHETIAFTELEKDILALIKAHGMRGATRGFLTDKMREGKFKGTDFNGAFMQLRAKLGPSIQQIRRRKTTAYALNPRAMKP